MHGLMLRLQAKFCVFRSPRDSFLTEVRTKRLSAAPLMAKKHDSDCLWREVAFHGPVWNQRLHPEVSSPHYIEKMSDPAALYWQIFNALIFRIERIIFRSILKHVN